MDKAANGAKAQGDGILRLFLSGDVMTGRGIDQILPHPCDARLYEDYVESARAYVRLAERASGKIPAERPPFYIWGAANDAWERLRPDARIVNLETSITLSDHFAPKGIHYRMSPQNAACLIEARIDCCALANNHILDFGVAGLIETLDTLDHLRIKRTGAGRSLDEARAPAIVEIKGKGRVIVFSFAAPTSGTPKDWGAGETTAGVNLLPERAEEAISWVADWSRRERQPGDLIVVSVHWGPNWSYEIDPLQRRLAHGWIDTANVSAVHGHSSHHPKAIEIYKDRLVLYGCGDFLNDYEGIGGFEQFRGDLTLMYFAEFDLATGALAGLELVPLQMRQLKLVDARVEDTTWLHRMLAREGHPFGTEISVNPEGRLGVSWRPVMA
jgi:poly-gamma-glutamate synthesis protein (capsule biosynthesis protein)